MSNPAAPPAPARVHPTVPGDDEVFGAVLLQPGDLGELAAAKAVPHAAAVLVAVAAPGGALAVARGVPAGVVQADWGPLHPGVPAAQGAPGRVRDEGVGRADGEVVVMPGLLEYVVVVVTVVTAVFLDDIVVVVTGHRVPWNVETPGRWEVERVAAARRLGVDVLDDGDVPGGRDVGWDALGDVDVDKDLKRLLLLSRLETVNDYFLAHWNEHLVRWWTVGDSRENHVCKCRG